MDTQQEAAKPDLLGRLFLIPAFLEPHLRTLGAKWWAYVSGFDSRQVWRWLALNWHRIAARWLTLGLILTALFLTGALITWRNPDMLMAQLLGWGFKLAAAGTALAQWGALIMLVLALPVLLPALLLTGLLLIGALMLLIVFGAPLLLLAAAFAVVVFISGVKRGGSWLVTFVAESLFKSDESISLARKVADMLGLGGGASTTLKGQPRLMEGDEFKRFKAENMAQGKGGQIFLGRVQNEPFHLKTEKHVFIAASSRSGKGRDLIIPNLHLYPDSVFVLDPKGENCVATAKSRAAKGHTIAAFDPYGLTGLETARFNPLDALQGTEAEMITGADYLAEALVFGLNDHWHESARMVIRALVLHLVTASDELLGMPQTTAPAVPVEGADAPPADTPEAPAPVRPQLKRDLPTLRELLTGAFDATLDDMKKNMALDGLVMRLAESIIDTPKNERGSILSTARRGTKWLDNPKLADLFKAGDRMVDFGALRDDTQKLSVYICLPPMVFATYPQVCRLLTTFALDTMMRKLTNRRRPVMFILDELAQLEHLPIVERAFTLSAGFGVQVWAVFQSIKQASKLYPIDVLYGSAGVRCFFKIEDPDSCEFISRASSGVFTPADVRRLSGFDMLTLCDGTNPLLVERIGKRLPAKA